MTKYKHKERGTEIKAMTFDELVEYGKANGANIVNGMPWSFKYGDHPITHENDECYLIPTPHLHGNYPYSKFTPNDILIVGIIEELTPVPIEDFKNTYELS